MAQADLQVFYIKLGVGIFSGLLTITLSVCSFFIVRWMNKVEKAITQIDSKVQNSQVKEAALLAKIETCAESVGKVQASQGAITTSIGRVWDILVSKGIAVPRDS